jgi:hypothetical protein
MVMFAAWGIETIVMLRSKPATETNGIAANNLPAESEPALKRVA